MLRSRPMSGQRCSGSSCGRARCTIANGTRSAEHPLGQLAYRYFVRIAEIDRSGDIVGGRHQAHEALDQIVDIAKRPASGCRRRTA